MCIKRNQKHTLRVYTDGFQNSTSWPFYFKISISSKSPASEDELSYTVITEKDALNYSFCSRGTRQEGF